MQTTTTLNDRSDLACRDEQLWKPARAADFLSVPTSWVYDAARAGKLPHVRIGRHVRFVPSRLKAWALEQNGEEC